MRDDHDPRVAVAAFVGDAETFRTLRRRIAAIHFQDYARTPVEEIVCAQTIEHRLRRAQCVRRIGKDQIELRAAQLLQSLGKLVAHDARALFVLQIGDVSVDDAAGARVALDEDRALRAARERFESKRTGAGVEIEHREPIHALPEGVEEALSYAIRGRPSGGSRDRPQRATSRFSADDPHRANGTLAKRQNHTAKARRREKLSFETSAAARPTRSVFAVPFVKMAHSSGS